MSEHIPIVEVLVMEDRAHVTRRGRVNATEGRTRIVVDDVAPVIVDKSLTVTGGTETVKVADARVVRTAVHLDEDAAADTRALDAELEAARERQAAIASNLEALSLERVALERLAADYLRELAEDAALGRALGEAQRAGYEALRVRLADLAAESARTELERDEHQSRVRALQAQAAQRKTPSKRVRARLEIELEGSAAAELELTASYVVANACWRPRHRATLDEAASAVALSCHAVAWQNTGEDWPSVPLSFSTERPSLGANPPELETEWLATMRKTPIVLEAREEQVAVAGLGGGEGAAAKKTSDLPGIDDGGEPLLLRSREAVVVASDGRPHEVPLFDVASKAELELVAFPELLLAATLKVTFTNTASAPLLPGPVELLKNGGPVGRAQLAFVARGERVALGWGPDPNIRLHRQVEPLKDESSILGSWTTRTSDIRIRLSNLGAEARRVVVRERVGISEIDKLQITTSPKHTTQGLEPDENGFVTWTVEVKPHARQLLELRVTQRRHSDLG
ncbi:MAG: mucoidy inhibitor MuiA family protein [Polyangiaceae bacterium]